MKMDLHTLTKRGLSWDDAIPDDLRLVWISHFEMMQEIGTLRFQRAVVPEDSVNLDINTIDAADASNKMACVAIYARFLRRNGTSSCQLVFSRSKVVHNTKYTHLRNSKESFSRQSQRKCQIE